MTPTERRVAAIYSDILGADDVELEDDVFTLGGDSLLAIRIFLELERVFGMSFPPHIFVDVRSVRGIAGWIDRNASSEERPAR